MSRSGKLGIVLVLLAMAIGLAIFGAMAFLRSSPPTVDFAAGHPAGQPVDMTLQTVGSIGFGSHPTWVSYMTRAPDGQWIHTTLWDLPAHTRVNVTIDQYDSGSPLRNQEFGLITGTVGGKALLNGKPISLVDSINSANGVGHTFTIPALNVSVPLYGIAGDAKNPCSVAPCATTFDHNVVQFSFTTPGPGQYSWQCFVPCALGYLFGNGGAMQTVGYMGGFLKVVA